MRQKKADTYAKELREKIEKKYGKYDDCMDEQVVTAAMNRTMIDKLHKELMDGSLTTIAVGSMGQQKTEINPLLAAYDKAQRTYIQQLAALGLNRLSEKKAEATQTDKVTDSPWTRFNQDIQ